MSQPQIDTQEALLAELDMHKVEFETLRAEILHWMEADTRHFNLSLTAIAAVLGFAPIIIDNELYFLVLIIPIVFHILLWEMLNTMKSITYISTYLINFLIPRVNAIIDKLGRTQETITTLGWEIFTNKQAVRASSLLLASITPTRHWVPILAVGGLLVAFGIFVRVLPYVPTTGELLLVVANILLLVLASIRNIQSIRAARAAAFEYQKTLAQAPDKGTETPA